MVQEVSTPEGPSQPGSVFITNAWLVLKRAWSVRLMLLGGALSGVAAVFPEVVSSLGLSPQITMSISAFVSAAAILARVLSQPNSEIKE